MKEPRSELAGHRGEPQARDHRGLHARGDRAPPPAAVRRPYGRRDPRAPARRPPPAPLPGLRRRAPRPRPAGQADPAGVRLRPAGRDLHRHLGPARRVPGRVAGRPHALGGRGPRGLRRAQRLVRPGGPGPAHALAGPPQTGRHPRRRPAGWSRRRRRAGGLPPRDLPGRRHRPRRARDDGRVVPHGRALPDVQGARFGRALRGDQRRHGPDHPGREARGGLPLRQDHAGDAGARSNAGRGCVGSATSSARSTRRWPSPSPWPPGR